MFPLRNNITPALINLGKHFSIEQDDIKPLILQAHQINPWFTPSYIQKALDSISVMLNEKDVINWVNSFPQSHSPKNIGLILAGNIPMVGFHDILCVIASGNKALIKLSSQDNILIPFILQKLKDFDAELNSKIEFVEKLKNFDAVIATGSNNSSRYFESYFKHVPNIIRKNRNSVAILNGHETAFELQQLGNDLFDYFGLGCRSIAKLYVPKNYDFMPLLDQLNNFNKISTHNKYMNNYDYNKSINLINKIPHLDNGFVIIKQNPSLHSPIAVIHYDEYENEQALTQHLTLQKDLIQCIASQHYQNKDFNIVTLGNTQKPTLWDYADGINTMEFLYSNFLPLTPIQY